MAHTTTLILMLSGIILSSSAGCGSTSLGDGASTSGPAGTGGQGGQGGIGGGGGGETTCSGSSTCRSDGYGMNSGMGSSSSDACKWTEACAGEPLCDAIQFNGIPGEPSTTVMNPSAVSCVLSALKQGDVGSVGWSASPSPNYEWSRGISILPNRLAVYSTLDLLDLGWNGSCLGPAKLRDASYFDNCPDAGDAEGLWNCLEGAVVVFCATGSEGAATSTGWTSTGSG